MTELAPGGVALPPSTVPPSDGLAAGPHPPARRRPC